MEKLHFFPLTFQQQEVPRFYIMFV